MTRHAEQRAVALTIAGSDSGGGAGIQADLKTFHAFGVFGTAAVTAVTAQNTCEVRSVGVVEPDLVTAQIAAVADDLSPSACKSGMLADETIIGAVAVGLEAAQIPHYVLDPVMASAGGSPLLEASAIGALKTRLFPLADLVTPNLDEAGILAGFDVRDHEGMLRAGEAILELGCRAVLIKGGHLESDEVEDLLVLPDRSRVWRAPKHPIGNAHGTGCTLSAAITAGLAVGRPLEEAIDRGLSYTRRAIETAPRLGRGSRPLNHWARD
ncbi:MAG: bifunctional hydroxymethylpyrimidine kinase/phosphomethylpyrimidine kinase [Gemmatimonadota bacterium]|nr:bifunctional hydroxymethylpyrimidine kinase/phosphomethylpyrimidine kinase [Gemmatimonadota bacterium]MDH3428016.1 bifunctional hydroxymethylpyrimidine kinase/phosphomethylpyrimidine kinase [Gemmatimonadota bacterium]